MNLVYNKEEFKEMISKEKSEFRKQLPDLLKKHHGKWVIFKDGSVIDVFESHPSAYARALDLFGIDQPFLIEKVLEEEPRPLSFAIELGTIHVT